MQTKSRLGSHAGLGSLVEDSEIAKNPQDVLHHGPFALPPSM